MQYTVEDISPVKKKINVTVPVNEVASSLAAAIALYQGSLTLKGFRKGKAPAGLIEQRFHKEVYGEAASELVNQNVSAILEETKFTPVSRFEFDSGELERDKEFTYSVTFETLPEFDLPQYEGLTVEQEEAEASDEHINTVIERLRNNAAKPVPVEEDRQAADGDVVDVDFAGRDEKGEALEAVTGKGFVITLGEGQTLPDFENLIRGLKKGGNTEGPMTFPEDYFNKDFAGRTVTVNITLNSLSEKKLPEADDAFAQQMGMADMNAMRDSIRDSYLKSRSEGHKAAAKEKLLEAMVATADFPVPDVMLDANIEIQLNNMRETLEQMQQGGGLDNMGTPEELRAEVRPQAEKRSREQILLLCIARKNNLEVSDQEAELQIRRMAMQGGQDPKAALDFYTKNNYMPALKERLLEDKALDFVYDKAVVSMVPQKAPIAAGEAGEEKQESKVAKKKPKKASAPAEE